MLRKLLYPHADTLSFFGNNRIAKKRVFRMEPLCRRLGLKGLDDCRLVMGFMLLGGLVTASSSSGLNLK